MAFFQLNDGKNSADVSIFPDLYARSRATLNSGGIVLARGTTGLDDRSGLLSLKAESLWTLDTARKMALTGLVLDLPNTTPQPGFSKKLQTALRDFIPGHTSLVIRYPNPDGDRVSIALGDQWRVSPSDLLFEALFQLCGDHGIAFQYRTQLLVDEPPRPVEARAA